jgi:glycerophosphoryl diester phosphodiesterase
MKKIAVISFLVILISLIILLLCTHFIKEKKVWINIAHRGEASRVSENTIPAIKEAIKYSYNGVEIDLRRTSDGVIILNHDKKVTGSVNGKTVTYTVSKTTYKKLKKVVLMSDEEYGDIYMATFEEVLKFAQENNIELAIHCKIQDDEFLTTVAQMVVDNDMSGKCIYNVVSDYENRIKLITSIDKNARFHVKYTYLFENDNGLFDFLDNSRIAITVKANLLDDDIFNKIKESGGLFYTSSVNNENIMKVLSYEPDYIEYSEKVDFD